MRLIKRLRKWCRLLMEGMLKIIIKVSSIPGTEYAEVAMRAVCREYEKNNDKFIQYRLYPKSSENAYAIDFMKKMPGMAIVIQGPLDKQDNFTLETVKLYKVYYPNALIIVSTWTDEDKEYLDEIEKSGAVIVTSDYPEKSGRGNVNYQCISTLQGIKKAKEMGAEYVMKNRSDMRMYRRYALEYMYNLWEKYPLVLPVSPENMSYRPHGRIITDGYVFDSGWLQDFYYFGHVNDLLTLFGVALDQTNEYKKYNINKSMREQKTRKEFLAIYGPAQYFWNHYIKLLGGNEGGIKEYWRMVKNYFICIGWEELEFYWHKYDIRYSMNLRYGIDIDGDSKEYPLTYRWKFSNWFNLYCGQMKYEEAFEKYEQNNWKP